jgi:hypothetical protein
MGQKAKKNPKTSLSTSDQQKKLTQKKMNEYHVQGKCFKCGLTGHHVKDCPRWNRAKALTLLQAADVSVQFWDKNQWIN